MIKFISNARDWLFYQYNKYGRYRYRKTYSYDDKKLHNKIEAVQMAFGSMRANSACDYASIHEAEFKVFSHEGEDGIIQYLIKKVVIENDVFIEFGVEDYRESNTRFLLQNNCWRGLIIDSGTRHIQFLNNADIMWQYDIEPISKFITAENINSIIQNAGYLGDIGLLSIDVDGNDYWILKAIDVVSPRILIIEYNSLFGYEHAVTVPYRPDFSISKSHYSELYYGASLPAIILCAQKKGYQFVGCNKGGSNAFFIRKDVIGALPTFTVEEGYVKSHSRLSRNKWGRRNYITNHCDQLKVISHKDIYDVELDRTVKIADIFQI